MSTTELKYTLFKAIDSINDTKILKEIYNLVANKTNSDFWENLTAAEKAEIENAIKELDAELGIPHEKVMAKYKNKYL